MDKTKQVFYIRVSTPEQNPSRQHKDLHTDGIVLVDICSGSIPLFERPEGKILLEMIQREEVYQITVHQLDRLGRDTLDVLTTIKFLMSKGINRRRDRQAEGIAKAKERGVYIGGTAKATRKPETLKEFLAKPKTKKVVRVLKEGNSLRRTAKICDVSLVFVIKVSKALAN